LHLSLRGQRKVFGRVTSIDRIPIPQIAPETNHHSQQVRRLQPRKIKITRHRFEPESGHDAQ
jgi:hypothetical protein